MSAGYAAKRVDGDGESETVRERDSDETSAAADGLRRTEDRGDAGKKEQKGSEKFGQRGFRGAHRRGNDNVSACALARSSG